MHKPEPVLQYEMHDILWDFERQTNHLIPAWTSDLGMINQKQDLPYNEHWRSDGSQSENQREWKETSSLDLTKERSKLWNTRATEIPFIIGTVWNGSQKRGKEDGRVGNRRRNRYHPNGRIVKIGQNTEICCQSDFSKRPSADAGVKN